MSKPTQAELRHGYDAKHCCCPVCGRSGLETTTIGIAFLGPSTRDTNRAKCQCGWVGIVHDMIPLWENDHEST